MKAVLVPKVSKTHTDRITRQKESFVQGIFFKLSLPRDSSSKRGGRWNCLPNKLLLPLLQDALRQVLPILSIHKNSQKMVLIFLQSIISTCFRSRKRRLTDSCGHERCFSCIFRNDLCPICHNSGKISLMCPQILILNCPQNLVKQKYPV